MVWLKNNLSWLALVFVLGMGAALYLTGKLELHLGGREVTQKLDNHGAEGVSHPEKDGEHHTEVSHVVGGKVVLDEDSLRASEIRTSPATHGSVALSLHATGEVQLAEGRFAHVTPSIAGVVREIYKTVGESVAVGTPLCTIESVELGEARAAYVSARSERTLAERNYHRWKLLYEKGLKTQNEFWAAENDFTRARLREEAAGNKLKALGMGPKEVAELGKGGRVTVSSRYVVTSPITGSILQRQHVTLGEYLDAKDQIFLIGDLSEVWVQAAAYERDLSVVHHGMAAVVTAQGFSGVSFTGRVTYVGQEVDEKTRTVMLRVAVKNRPIPGSQEPFALRPGMFATVDLATSHKGEVLVVPLSAVQSVNGETVVFVPSAVPEPSNHDAQGLAKDPKGALAFERRVVTLGARDADVVEVMQGVEPGEPVVVENAYLLKSEFEKSKIAGED